jgi:Enterobacter phage Enc34, ssDNA-binding protein
MSKYLTASYNKATGEFLTPRCRMVYPALLKPRIPMNATVGTPKYSVTFLVPAMANLDVLKEAVDELRIRKLGKTAKLAHEVFIPTSKFDKLREFADQYPTLIRLSATEEFPPFLFKPNTQPLDRATCGEDEIYGGRWAVAAIKPYVYTKPSGGIAFGLQRLQLLDHDEPIAGGRVTSSEGFDTFDPAGGQTTDELWDDPAKMAS